MVGLSRTILARVFAAWLAVLAASPVTAPFMTCDWSELGHDHSTAATHVGGAAIAAPDVKTPADPNTTLFTAVVATAIRRDPRREPAHPLPSAPATLPVRAIVLRI